MKIEDWRRRGEESADSVSKTREIDQSGQPADADEKFAGGVSEPPFSNNERADTQTNEASDPANLAPAVETGRFEKDGVLAYLATVNPTLAPVAFAATLLANCTIKPEVVGSVEHIKPSVGIESIAGMSWKEGVSTLLDDTFTNPREVGANFYIGESGTQKFFILGTDTASAQSVYRSRKEIRESLTDFTNQTNGEKIKLFCEVHTHPLSALVAEDLITEEEWLKRQTSRHGLMAPPSLVDINLFKALDYLRTPQTPIMNQV